MTRYRLLAVLVSAAGLVPATALGQPPETRPATRSLAELTPQLEAARQRLKSLSAEYVATIAIDGQPLPENTILRTVAAKGRARFLSTIKYRDGRPVAGDPNHTHSFYDGTTWNAFYVRNRAYETNRRFTTDEYTIKARGEAMLESLGWWPPDDPSAPPIVHGHPFFVHELLAKEKCEVAGEQQLLRGQWCHVLVVPGKHRLWFTAAGDLLQRECLIGGGAVPVLRHELDDYRDVGDGVRLPFTVRRSLTDQAARRKDMEYRVVRYTVNAVPDSTFHFTPVPGTIVYNRDNDTHYQVPGGFELLEKHTARVKARTAGRGPDRGPWGLGLAAVLAGFAAVLALGRLAGRAP